MKVALRDIPNAVAGRRSGAQVLARMKTDAFRREMDRRGVFYELLTHYAQALVGFIMQSTACNAVHSVERRLARWLLVARDRMDGVEFPLTQEFAAMMLGESPDRDHRREHVPEGGADHLSPGHLAIVDGDGLEAGSCECYRATTDLLNAVTERARVSSDS